MRFNCSAIPLFLNSPTRKWWINNNRLATEKPMLKCPFSLEKVENVCARFFHGKSISHSRRNEMKMCGLVLIVGCLHRHFFAVNVSLEEKFGLFVCLKRSFWSLWKYMSYFTAIRIKIVFVPTVGRLSQANPICYTDRYYSQIMAITIEMWTVARFCFTSNCNNSILIRFLSLSRSCCILLLSKYKIKWDTIECNEVQEFGEN